jgi:polyhydroxyalkanoate synthesis regulator phasin
MKTTSEQAKTTILYMTSVIRQMVSDGTLSADKARQLFPGVEL